MIHSRWYQGDLIFYDGTHDIMTIKDDDDGIEFGVDSSGVDVLFYGDTASAYMEWNADDNELDFDGATIALNDTDAIKFGDDEDFTIACTAADILEILPASANDDMYLGSTGYPLDVVNYGNITYRDPATVNSTSAITLTATSNRMQFVDSCGQAITMTLPAIADCAGIEFKIYNTTGSSDITVNDTGDNLIATIAADEVGYLLCNGVVWGASVGITST